MGSALEKKPGSTVCAVSSNPKQPHLKEINGFGDCGFASVRFRTGVCETHKAVCVTYKAVSVGLSQLLSGSCSHGTACHLEATRSETRHCEAGFWSLISGVVNVCSNSGIILQYAEPRGRACSYGQRCAREDPGQVGGCGCFEGGTHAVAREDRQNVTEVGQV
eukprot:708482-Rhodomonas_salina.3